MTNRPNFEYLTDLALAGQSLQGTELHASIAEALADAYAAGVRQGRADMRIEAAGTVEKIKGGFTADVFDPDTLIPDQDGPWGLNSTFAAAIRALPDTPA